MVWSNADICVYVHRDNAVWNATREICATYSVPYYKPIKPLVEGAEPELPPWMRVRGGGERKRIEEARGGSRWRAMSHLD